MVAANGCNLHPSSRRMEGLESRVSRLLFIDAELTIRGVRLSLSLSLSLGDAAFAFGAAAIISGVVVVVARAHAGAQLSSSTERRRNDFRPTFPVGQSLIQLAGRSEAGSRTSGAGRAKNWGTF